MLFAQAVDKEKRKDVTELLPTRCKPCMKGPPAPLTIPKRKPQAPNEVVVVTDIGQEANTLQDNVRRECSEDVRVQGGGTTEILTGDRDLREPAIADIPADAGPLPSGWKRVLSRSKGIYYYCHPETGYSTFNRKEVMEGDVTSPSKSGSMMEHAPTPRSGAAATNMEGDTSETIEIPTEKVGLVIGANGVTIKSLQSESSAKISFCKASGPYQSCTVTGTSRAVNQAKASILRIVHAPAFHQHSAPHGESSASNTPTWGTPTGKYTPHSTSKRRGDHQIAPPGLFVDPSLTYVILFWCRVVELGAGGS